MREVAEVRVLDGFTVHLVFDDGSVRTVDLEPAPGGLGRPRGGNAPAGQAEHRHRQPTQTTGLSLLSELSPGGLAKELNASDVDRFLARLHPATVVEQTR